MSERDNGFSYKDGVSLKEYFEARLHSLEIALTLARDALEKRLEAFNEVREQLKENTGRFSTRQEHDFLMKEIQTLQLMAAELRGKASQSSVNVSYLIAVVSMVISIVSVIYGAVK